MKAVVVVVVVAAAVAEASEVEPSYAEVDGSS